MKYHFKEPHKLWSTNESSSLKGENLISIILRDYKLCPHTSTRKHMFEEKCTLGTYKHTHTHLELIRRLRSFLQASKQKHTNDKYLGNTTFT